jgi:hypothetical protein
MFRRWRRAGDFGPLRSAEFVVWKTSLGVIERASEAVVVAARSAAG